jgi:ATP-binding cassette subfamily F protein 3
MDSLEWLENYLKSYKGSIILVSHDSRFLDNIVERIIEISQGKTTEYKGNYSSYIIQKNQQADILRSTYANQQKFIQKTARFIERFRYKNTKAKQVQSRIKMLEKMEKIDIDTDEQEIFFHFPEPPYTGRIIMELEGINKSYGTNHVFKNLSLYIERGEKIAILGVNGSGKSTLARIIAGTESFQKGKRTPAKNTVISYYSQNTAEELDNDQTVFDTLNMMASKEAPEQLRTLLGCFLFTEDDAFKPVKVLSGGEKSRLALARMLLNTANLLILDEPTNHLDIRSKAILQEGLEQYTGSCIIISHDRDFLAPITDKIFSLKKGKLESHFGSVDEYLEKCHREKQEETPKTAGEKPKPPVSLEKERKREEAERRQELYRRINPLQAAQDKIEREIEKAEQNKAEKEAAFSEQKTYESEEAIRRLNIEHAEVSSRLETLYRTWTKIDEDIAKIKKDMSTE